MGRSRHGDWSSLGVLLNSILSWLEGSVMLNSATQIAITKLDVIFPDCAQKTSFDSLSDEAKVIHSQI